MDELTPSRRTVVRGAAWTVPVVATAATAPAFAASTCTAGPARTVRWQTNTDSDSNYTTQTGTLQGNTLGVVSAYTGAAGSLSTTKNMVSFTVNATRDSFELSNVIPPSTTPSATIANNYQTATFTFGSRVSSVTFTIDDIDSTTGDTAFWDRVAVIAGAGGSASGTFNTGSTLTGSGTVAAPWYTSSNNDAGGYAADQSVNVTVAGAFTTFQIRYWTTVGAPTSNAQMWIRIRNMQVKTCV